MNFIISKISAMMLVLHMVMPDGDVCANPRQLLTVLPVFDSSYRPSSFYIVRCRHTFVSLILYH